MVIAGVFELIISDRYVCCFNQEEASLMDEGGTRAGYDPGIKPIIVWNFFYGMNSIVVVVID